MLFFHPQKVISFVFRFRWRLWGRYSHVKDLGNNWKWGGKMWVMAIHQYLNYQIHFSILKLVNLCPRLLKQLRMWTRLFFGKNVGMMWKVNSKFRKKIWKQIFQLMITSDDFSFMKFLKIKLFSRGSQL